MSKARILVVDDEPAVLKVLVTRLQLAGYQVFSATNGEEALESFHKDSPDLIVLDVMLPKMDGFAVCRRIRAESVVPIIFLTALEAISERVAGLDLGADDYLSKPFEPKELLLRLERLLIRNNKETSNKPERRVKIGNKVFDLQRLELYQENNLIKLTNLEISLLNFFALNPAKTISREMVINNLDLNQGKKNLNKRNVDVQITRLRKKIEVDPTNPRHLKTVRGKGYQFLP